jgi:hypothetical protein
MGVSIMGIQPLVNCMTNWQRTQWARSGYPQDEALVLSILKRKPGAHQPKPRDRKRKSYKMFVDGKPFK